MKIELVTAKLEDLKPGDLFLPITAEATGYGVLVTVRSDRPTETDYQKKAAVMRVRIVKGGS